MADNTPTSLNQNVLNNDIESLAYAINQLLLQVNTVLPCRIININNDGTYDVQSLINGLNADRSPITPPVINNIPASYEMGHNAGVIIEYAVNDTVLVGFCQRDISVVSKNWQQGNPQTLRKFSLSDGIILKRLSNSTPIIFIKLTSSGIELQANGNPITLTGSEINLNGAVNINGESYLNHTHTGVQSGNMNTGGVTP